MFRGIGAAAATVMVVVAALSPRPASAAPAILDSWAGNVSAAAAELSATANPNGHATVARFEYITALDYEGNLKASRPAFEGAVGVPTIGLSLGSSTAPVDFTQPIGGLAAATRYIYRATAFDSSETTLGSPRSFTTTPREGVAFVLPDGRGWEMVSPIDKNGGEIQPPGGVLGGGLFQAAASGGALTYSSTASFGAAQGAPGASQYVSTRGASGWSTRNVTRPSVGGGYGDPPDGVPFQLFGPSLSGALAATPWGCADSRCRRAYELLDLTSGSASSSPSRPDLRAVAVSEDLSTVLLSTCAKLTPNATEAPLGGGCDPAQPNLYLWSGGTLRLVNLLPGDTTGTPGATVAASAGDVSADGSRVYFSLAGDLYLRQGEASLEVDVALGGGASLEVASADGSLAYFTKGAHLYRYAAGGGASDLTPAGGVLGVLGASPNGEHVYYLTADGVQHRVGVTTTKVADGADPSSYPPASASARVGANGNLAFLDSGPWPDSDNVGHSEVFVYRPATSVLTCVSCNPTGARSIGPSSIPGETANGAGAPAYRPRALSGDGNRLFFESADSLVLGDTNGARDVYQWEAQGVGSCERAGGCVALISSGRSPGGATFLDASTRGDDIYFTTDGSLVPSDPGAVDVYVARVGGGFPVPDPPIPCLADACQPVPSAPLDPVVATTVLRPEANPPLTLAEDPKPRAPKPKPKKKKHRRGAKHKHAQAGNGHARGKRHAKGDKGHAGRGRR
jgi:hypothetical protein